MGNKSDLNVSLREHFEALLDANDRRYAEVNTEREKALKIKETADLAALQLAREIQSYKDEKANQLREQINSERGLYATNKDIEPLKTYMAGQTGRGLGMNALFGWAMAILMLGVAIAAVYVRR
jgi:hypothetical protein